MCVMGMDTSAFLLLPLSTVIFFQFIMWLQKEVELMNFQIMFMNVELQLELHRQPLQRLLDRAKAIDGQLHFRILFPQLPR